MSLPILLKPLEAIWKLLSSLLQLTGRLLVGIIGLLFLILGAAACLTVIGSIVGIPLIVLGVILVLRSLF